MSGKASHIYNIVTLVIACSALFVSVSDKIDKNLYQSALLNGKWSTDAEYVINNKDMGLSESQPLAVMQLSVDDYDGSINGEIITEGLCDAMPLTWNITLNSDAPRFYNFFIDRTFQVRQLIGGAMDTSKVEAELKLIKVDRKHQALKFEVISDNTHSLPKFISFGKDLPKFEENYNYLQDYCADPKNRFKKHGGSK